MRSYYLVFLSPDGTTIAESDEWGNYDARALMLGRISKQNAITTWNFLRGSGADIALWDAFDSNGNRLFRQIAAEDMSSNIAFGGLRLYRFHPKN